MRRRTRPRSSRSSRRINSASTSTACSASSSRSAPVSRRPRYTFGQLFTAPKNRLDCAATARFRRFQPMAKDAKSRRTANLATPNDLGANASKEVSGGLNILLADVIALYFKTKNFHWHVSGPHFRDYHLLLDDQATQIDAMTDVIAERVRKLGA